MTDIQRALRVEIAGNVTSFRYPHFTQGYQPTYEMPPPSTIYGHLCSVMGRYLTLEERQGMRFGFVFQHAGKFIDYMEHLHFHDPIQPFPFDRELLFQPRFTLYLTGVDLNTWETAFQRPYFTAVLGRSQDLVSFTSIEQIDLLPTEQGYFEHTLLPEWMAPRLGGDVIVVNMARYIDPRRRVQWQNYALLRGQEVWPPAPRAALTEEEAAFGSVFNQNWQVEGDELPLLYDPSTVDYKGYSTRRRLVYLHSFMGVLDEIG